MTTAVSERAADAPAAQSTQSTASRSARNKTLTFLLRLCAGLTAALVVFLIGYVLIRGVPHITWNF